MIKKTIQDVYVNGKRVLLRVDYNVPMVSKIIMDDYRIKKTFPTIEYLIKNKVSKLVIVSHLGRPKGRVIEDCTLFPVFEIVRKHLKPLGADLKFLMPYDSRIDENAYVFLENIRFLDEEENIESEKSEYLANFLAKNADLLVVDAFGTLHRDCTSITKINLPTVAGFLVEKELSIVNSVLEASSRNKKPLDLFLLGGKKISDKVKLLEKLIPKCKEIYLFGALCFPFLRSRNLELGDSYEEDLDPEITQKIENLCKENGTRLKMPIDFVVIEKSTKRIFNTEKIQNSQICVDIGPKTIVEVNMCIENAKCIMWNGTPGIFEQKGSHTGTVSVITALMNGFESKKVLIGGGDTANAIQRFGDRQKFYHISTGGGALIAVLQGEALPGLERIQNKE